MEELATGDAHLVEVIQVLLSEVPSTERASKIDDVRKNSAVLASIYFYWESEHYNGSLLGVKRVRMKPRNGWIKGRELRETY